MLWLYIFQSLYPQFSYEITFISNQHSKYIPLHLLKFNINYFKNGGQRHNYFTFFLLLSSSSSSTVRGGQPLRRLQDFTPTMRRKMCPRSIFSSSRSPQVHHCSPCLRCQQYHQVLAGKKKHTHTHT